MNENIDRRILGAFRCIDAVTGTLVTDALSIGSAPWVVKPNRSSIYVIFDGPGFHSVTTDFVPANPPTSTAKFDITIQDPGNQYLPRRATINAPVTVPVIPPAPPPNDQAKASALGNPATVFCPQTINVFPSAAAPTALNWAVVRVSVVRNGTTQGLPWAVLQIVQPATGATSSTTLATGMTGANGEALLAVAGLKTSVAATIQVWFDPATLTQPSTWIPNPDDILTNTSNPSLKSATQAAQLGVGQLLTTSIPISV